MKRSAKRAIFPAILSATIVPGAGQIFNKEYVKGVFLIIASIGSFTWFSKVVTARLSMILPGLPDQWSTNPTALRDALMTLVNENSGMFLTFQLLIVLVWVFSVVDAYTTARKRILETPLPGDDEDTNAVG